MNLVPFEVITLSLPGFRSALPGVLLGSAPVDFTVLPAGALLSAVFNAVDETLDLIIAQHLPPDVPFLVTILRTSQIYVSHEGIRWNQTGLALSSSAADGAVLPIDITKTNAVGTIFGTAIGADPPFLEYEPRIAGEAATLLFHFVCSMVVDANETFVVHLPEFTSTAPRDSPVLIDIKSPFSQGTWVGYTSTLIFTLAERIEARTPLFVSIASSEGILLPLQGMRSRHRLTIQTDAEAGRREPIQLHSATLGNLAGTNLRYRSVFNSYTGIAQGKRNFATSIFLGFTPSMTILPGELVMVYLDRFQGPQIENVAVTSEPSGSFSSASWMSGGNLLVLTALQGVSEYTRTQVSIDSSVGITLPIDGVKANQTSLWISVAALDGPVWRPAVYTPASGGLAAATRSTVISTSEAVGVCA